MWTCPKCGGNVGDQFPACQLCGTGADGTAAPPPSVDALNGPPRANFPLRPPPELRAVVPPPPTLQERLLNAAKWGAFYGALNGAMLIFILWGGLMISGAWTSPAGALAEGLPKGILVGAAIGAPISVLFRLIFPHRPPPNQS